MMIPRHALLGLALSSPVIAASSLWFWRQVFFRDFSVLDTGLAVAVTATAVLLFAAAILLISERAVVPLRVALLVALAFILYGIVRPYFGVESISALARGILIGISLLLAAWAVDRWSGASWDRLYLAVIAFSLIFFASFPIVGFLLRTEGGNVLGFDFLKREAEAAKNVGVLLLDELSPESAGPIGDAMRRAGVNVHVAKIAAAGKNTNNAIPAMFTGERFDRVMPCGLTLLCSEGKSLDYSALRAADNAVDIVSFLAFYCSIQNLRSCVSIQPTLGLYSAFRSLACAIKVTLMLSPCEVEMDKIRPTRFAMRRKEMERALFSTQFWEKGGLLYAHLPLPHPPGDEPSGSLLSEYQANIAASTELVAKVVQKLQDRFGEEFVFVVISDHPLRVDVHCGLAVYRSADCKTGLPENRNQVPLIVASPKPLYPPSIGTALGFLGEGWASTVARGARR